MRKRLLRFVVVIVVVVVSATTTQAVNTWEGYGCNALAISQGHATWAVPLCLMELAIAWNNDWLDDGTNWWY